MKLHNLFRETKALVIVLGVSICVVILLVLAVSIYLNYNCQPRRDVRLLLVFSALQDNRGYHLVDLHGCWVDLSEERAKGRPVWSPSGNHIAFLSPVNEDFLGPLNKDNQWFVVDVDIVSMAERKYRLLEGGMAHSLTWSADGTKLLFYWSSVSSEAPELWELDLATEQLSLLAHLPQNMGVVSWSPDRSRVVYDIREHGFYGCATLYLYDIGEKTKQVFNEDQCVSGFKDWSPNGEFIAFTLAPEASEPARLCWLSVISNETICSSQYYVSSIAWSPDSKQIAFSTQNKIDVMDILTKRVTTLVDTDQWNLLALEPPFKAYDLDWSSDGKYLAYAVCIGSSEATQTCKVHIMRVVDRKHWRLTSIQGAAHSPVLSPSVPKSD